MRQRACASMTGVSPARGWNHDYARRPAKVGDLVKLHDAIIVHGAAAQGAAKRISDLATPR